MNPPFTIPNNVPNFHADGGEVQIAISDYAIKSMLYTLHQIGKIKFNTKVLADQVPGLDTTNLDYFLPGIEAMYGAAKEVAISCTTAGLKSPSIALEKNKLGGVFSMKCDLNVYTSPDVKDTLFTFTSDFTFLVQLNLEKLSTGSIAVFVENLTMSKSALVSSKLPGIALDKIESVISLAIDWTIPILNEHFLQVIPIAIPKVPGVNFDKLSAQVLDNYIEIFLTPRFV